MQTRTCGRSSIEVSVLGIGCWSFGGGDQDYWGRQEQDDANDVVAAALDCGINYFDTAEAYNDGRSEQALGIALKGRRDQAVISTKVGPDSTRPDVLREHCEASLRRLNTDYVDIYYVHWPITKHSVQDAFDTLTALKSEGKIRCVCVSNFGVQQLTEALSTGAQIDLNQLAYSIITRAIEVELVPLCMDNRIGVVPYMTLMQGLLTGKYRTVDEIPPNRRRTRHFRGDVPPARHGEPGAEQETMHVVNTVRDIAEEIGLAMEQLSLAWAISKPGITSVLVGARDRAQVVGNAEAAGVDMPPELLKRLDDISLPLLEQLGTNCDYWQGGENSRTR